MPDLESIVLRTPDVEGDFKFYVAKLPRHEAQRLELQFAEGGVDPKIVSSFGRPLNLSQVMRELDTRDFHVFDLAAG
jgi:hypothetical protein